MLVVEDDDISRSVLLGLLNNIGVVGHGARTGAKALALLQESDFPLILMDIQMPVMDGLEATRHIRAHPDCSIRSEIPIVGVTAHTGKAANRQALDAGMDHCLAKPITAEVLKKALMQYAVKEKASDIQS